MPIVFSGMVDSSSCDLLGTMKMVSELEARVK